MKTGRISWTTIFTRQVTGSSRAGSNGSRRICPPPSKVACASSAAKLLTAISPPAAPGWIGRRQAHREAGLPIQRRTPPDRRAGPALPFHPRAEGFSMKENFSRVTVERFKKNLAAAFWLLLAAWFAGGGAGG